MELTQGSFENHRCGLLRSTNSAITEGALGLLHFREHLESTVLHIKVHWKRWIKAAASFCGSTALPRSCLVLLSSRSTVDTLDASYAC